MTGSVTQFHVERRRCDRPPREIAEILAAAVFRAEMVVHHPDRSNGLLRAVVLENVLAEVADLAESLRRTISRDAEIRAAMAREQTEKIVELEQRLSKARALWRQRGVA